MIAALSTLAALGQAGLLVLVSTLAVAGLHHSGAVELHGVRLGYGAGLVFGGALLGVFLVAGCAVAVLSARTGAAVLSRVRRSLIGGFLGADWEAQSSERLGNTQQLLTQHCQQAASVALGLASLLQSLASVVAMLVVAFAVNPTAAVLVLVAGALLAGLLRPFGAAGRRANDRYAKSGLRLATAATEYTRLARELRLFGVVDRAQRLFESYDADASADYAGAQWVGGIVPVIYQTIALFMLLAGLGLLTRTSTSSLASTGAVVLLTLRSLSYGSSLQGSTQFVRSQGAFLDGLLRQLEVYAGSTVAPSCAAPAAAGAAPALAGTDLVLSHVTFAYPDQQAVLHDLSFQLPTGSVLGVVGPSGSGKSTLSQIILGLRVPQEGSVTLGGTDTATLAGWRGGAGLAFVPQDPVLFEGSIADNIRFLREAGTAEVVDAARRAHLHHEIEQLPAGYDTFVGEAGAAISGGQRQRLAIARALLGSPNLLVLDEPTSALDPLSEQRIRVTLDEFSGKLTTVVISHRLGTVDHCDYLCAIKAGRIAAFGTAAEVLGSPAFRSVLGLSMETSSAESDGGPQPQPLGVRPAARAPERSSCWVPGSDAPGVG